MKAMMYSLLVFAVTLALVPGSASAQTFRLAPVNVEEGAWYFQPILRSDLGRVDSIVALAKNGAVSGNNIVAVWYQRGAEDTSAWTAKSWRTSSVEEAIKSVKSTLQLPDSDDVLWPVGDKTVMNAIPAPENPAEYYKGLLADDALAALVISSPDRDFIVSVLVDVGYKAADIDIEKFQSVVACDPSDVLTGIAKGAEVTADSGEMELIAHTYVAQRCAAISVCWPWTWNGTPGAWSPCVYGLWVFVRQTPRYDPTGTVSDCVYNRTCTQSQSRTNTHRYLDCTRATCTQTQTQTCTQEDYCLMAGNSCIILNVENDPQCIGELFGNGAPDCGVPSGFAPPCVW